MSKVIDWVLDHRWAMLPASLSALIDVVQRNASVAINPELFHKGDYDVDPKSSDALILSREEALVGETGERLEGSRRVLLRGTTAIVPIMGPIFPRANLFTAMSGATSLQSFALDFNAALDSPKVTNIILDVDSPGGEITDVEAMGEMIFAARDRKPITAFITGMGASAAFWLASSASDVVAAKTGEVGSIGVVAAVRDTSEKDKKAGVQNIEIVSSISPQKRPDFKTAEGRAGIQQIVNDLGVMFAETVARNRSTDFDNVVQNFGKGGVLLAKDALEVGMIDGISSLEALITQNNQPQSTSGGFMPKLVNEATKADVQAENPGVYNAILEEGKKQGLQEADVDAKVADARKEGAEAENERIKSIEAVPAIGSEQIVADNKFNMEMDAGQVSQLVLKDQADKRKAEGEKLKADGEKLGIEAGGIGASQSDPSASQEVDAAIVNAMAGGLDK